MSAPPAQDNANPLSTNHNHKLAENGPLASPKPSHRNTHEEDTGGKKRNSLRRQQRVHGGSGADAPFSLLDEELTGMLEDQGAFMTNSLGLWYFDTVAENEFIAYEKTRCGKRFFAFILISGLFSLIVLLSFQPEDEGHRLFLVIACAIQLVSGVAEGLLTCLEWKHRKTRIETDHRKKRHVLGNDHGVTATVEPANSIDEEAAASLEFVFPEGQTTTNEGRSIPCTASCGLEERTSTKDVRIAVYHERFCVVSMMASAIVTGLTHAYRQNHCVWIYHYSDEAQDDVQCPDRIYQYIFFMACMPLAVGQPRFFFVAMLIFLIFVILIAVLQFHNVTFFGTVMTFGIIFSIFAFILVLKWFSEQSNRRRFEVQWVLTTHTNEANREAEALKQFIQHVTPSYFHDRLEHPTESCGAVHIAENAVCFVVEAKNVPKFLTSMLPARSASILGQYFHHIAKNARRHRCHHIRAVGDKNYFVSNLFHNDVPQLRGTVALGLKYIFEHIFAVSPNNLEVGVGLSNGPLVGMPLGSTCIRYDIFGEAVNDAQMLAGVSQAKQVRLAQITAEAMEGHVILAQREEQPVHIACAQQDGVHVLGLAEDECSSLVSLEPGVTASRSTLGSAEEYPEIPDARATYETHLLAPQARSTSADSISVPSGLVEISTVCCCSAGFKDGTVAHNARLLHVARHRDSFTWINCFFAVVHLLIISVGATERRDDWDVPMTTFVILLILSSATHAGLATASRFQSSTTTSAWLFVGLSTAALLGFTGCNFSRPSVVGDNCGYLLWPYAYSWIFSGASLLNTQVTYALMIFLYYLLQVLFRPMVERVQLSALLGMVVPSVIAYLTKKSEDHQFAQLVHNDLLQQEIEKHRQVRSTIFSAVVPKAIQGRITADSVLKDEVCCWGSADCVVLSLAVDTGMMTNCTAEEIRDRMERTFGKIEEAVGASPTGTLGVVEAFGGSATLAGPLIMDRDATTALSNALQDAVHLLVSLLSQDSIQYTAAGAVDLAVNVLRLSEYPSYDLLGVAVNMSRAMTQAAPVHMTVVTERLAHMCIMEHRQKQDSESLGLQFMTPESWRLRDVGSMKVQRVALAATATSTEAFNAESTI